MVVNNFINFIKILGHINYLGHNLAEESEEGMKSIFIVDDSKLHNILLKKILDDCGYSVSAFTDGFSLLQNLQYTKPNLIISDINMPALNGFDLCREIKKNPARQDIPVMYVSSMQGDEIVRQSQACGAVGVVAKPLNKDSFLEIVAQNIHSSF